MKKAYFVLTFSTILAAVFAIPSISKAATDQWNGATNTSWNTTTNWSLGAKPTAADTVLFSTGSGSAANLATNNDIPGGASILGISNTLAPAGDISISGNPLTIGSSGIVFGIGASGATRSLAINTNITLSAPQIWSLGGTPATNKLTIGASSANTVDLNGQALTLKWNTVAGQTMELNSTISGTSKITLLRIGNGKDLIRFKANNSYSGGTDIDQGGEVVQLGSDSGAGTGPLGTGLITFTNGTSGGNPAFLEAYGGDRVINNNIAMTFTSPQTGNTMGIITSPGETNHKLTINGTITSLLGNRTITTDSTTAVGSGDLVLNGNILVGTSGQAGGSFTLGQSGGAPVGQGGKISVNGSILETAGVTTGVVVTVANGGAFATVVELSGQNTYSGGTTLGANGSALVTTTDPNNGGNIRIGSSSMLDGGGNIISGPLGKGALTFNNGGGTPRISAINGAQTVANAIIMTSAGIVQGADNLTLTGTISGPNGLTKNGTSKLTLTGTNSFAGNMTVNNGTLSVPTIAATGTNQPLGTSAAAISVGGATTAGTLEYTGAGATTLSRQISVGAGGATIRATAATGTGLTLNAATAVNVGANAVTFDGSGNTTVSTPITGTTGTLTKIGTGTLNLNATNTYNGMTTVNGGTLGGTGSVAGSVTVNAGGTLSPGGNNNIESLGTGSLTFNGGATSGSTLKFEIGPGGTADLVNAPGGSLFIDGTSAVGPTLSLVDLGAGAIADGTKYTVISYNGTWNGTSFANAPNDTVVLMGSQQFRIRYQDLTPGGNFTSETDSNTGVGKFVTLTAVPELGSFLTMGLVGCCALGAVRLGKRYGFNAISL